MNREWWCAPCRGLEQEMPGGRSAGTHGGDTKQDQLNRLCELPGFPHERVWAGSLPSAVVQVMARRSGAPTGSMPEIAEAVVIKAGLRWTADCDSRGSQSGGGSTVTREGLEVLNKAIGRPQ